MNGKLEMNRVNKTKSLLIILIIMMTNNLIGNEIVLNKNGVIISSNDLINYQKLHNDYYGKEINRNTALKNLYLAIKIIEIQKKNNPTFDYETDKIIIKDINKFKEKYDENIMRYFLKYQILKNDFIGFYVKNNNIKELDNLINNKIYLYEDSNCKTIKQIIFFKNLKISQKIIILNQLSKDVILLDNDTYTCLTNENRNEINGLINGIIIGKGNKKFLEYVYKNIE